MLIQINQKVKTPVNGQGTGKDRMREERQLDIGPQVWREGKFKKKQVTGGNKVTLPT